MTNKSEMQAEALARATQGQSLANYPTIFEAFMERGILEGDIHPRENVLTYQAWRAKGRQVRKGEKGVPVITWIDLPPKEDKNKKPGEISADDLTPRRASKKAYVFHITQTDAVQ